MPRASGLVPEIRSGSPANTGSIISPRVACPVGPAAVQQGSDIIPGCTTVLVDRRPPNRGAARIGPQAPHPSHEDAERCTDGFSSEKIAKVLEHGHLPD